MESSITFCMTHTISMFFTLEEQAFVNPIFLISCLGVNIPMGFIAYGLQFTTKWRSKKWYWLMIGIISTIVSALSFFLYPDNPESSVLFTAEEKFTSLKESQNNPKLP